MNLLLNLFVAFTSLLFSCHKPTSDPNPTETISKTDLVKAYESMPDGLSYSLAGDTTRPNSLTPLHPVSSQSLDVSALKNTDGTLRYVAIGASLTAGVRDGGWFNDGMNTSYPNLIARQMGITNFQQALFDDKEFNGYGLKLPTANTETPVPRFKAVSNNLAFKPQGVEMVLTPYTGKELNNLAVPNLGSMGYYDNLYEKTYNNTIYYKFLSRILNKSGQSISQKTNGGIITIEYYLQDILNSLILNSTYHLPEIYPYAGNDPYAITKESYTGGADLLMYNLYMSNNKKLVVLDIPNIFTFPYLKNAVKFSDIKAIFKTYNISVQDYKIDESESTTYLPSPTLDSLFKFRNDSKKFTNYYLSNFNAKKITPSIKSGVLEWIKIYNNHIILLSKKYNAPIVDIATLYQQVNDGTLVIEGKKVTDKEFFSSDGIYPTAYGQAIIANECIKTINDFYKTNIPLIQASYYLNR